jgi:DNA invertase Pin-like site-specific DNA recombinase
LKEEVKKGMREKAEQGIYPSRPPMGYRNNNVEHTIEIDPVKAPIANPTYRKPFDPIFQRVKKEEWLPGLDSN